jgi:glycosyltransferase 2 family protein
MRERGLRPVDVARWLATVGFFAVLLFRVDVRAVGARLARLDARFIALYLALSVPLYLLYAWRWRFTAARLNVTLPFRHAYGDYYLSTLLNQVLPVGIAGDIVRAARHRRRLGSASWGAPARAVILERASGFLALVLSVAVSALVWIARGHGRFAAIPFGAVVLLLVGACVFLARARHSPRLGAFATDARAALVDRGALGPQLGVSLASLTILVLMFACAGRAAGVVLDASAVVQVVPLIFAATTIPWAFAGWGAREVSAAALFGLVGVEPAAAVSVSVTFGILSLVAAAPGLLVWWLPAREVA